MCLALQRGGAPGLQVLLLKDSGRTFASPAKNLMYNFAWKPCFQSDGGVRGQISGEPFKGTPKGNP